MRLAQSEYKSSNDTKPFLWRLDDETSLLRPVRFVSQRRLHVLDARRDAADCPTDLEDAREFLDNLLAIDIAQLVPHAKHDGVQRPLVEDEVKLVLREEAFHVGQVTDYPLHPFTAVVFFLHLLDDRF